jgi:hypothetical protein
LGFCPTIFNPNQELCKHVIHPPKLNTPSSKKISLLAKGERGHKKRKRKNKCSKKHREKYVCAPIKEHRKKYVKHDPPLKARGESQSKEYLEKINKKTPHTCTSRSSGMTSFFLDLVFGSTTSCGTSDSLLSYQKLHIQAIELGS